MKNTTIEWTDHTFNPWIGCTKVSPGCANCYAATQDKFRGWTPEGWGKGKPRKRTSESNWNLPTKWNREAATVATMEKPHRQRVFCASLADWLDDEVPAQWLSDLIYLAAKCSNLDWQLLTKRPENFYSRMQEVEELGDVGSQIAKQWMAGNAPVNFWIGTTVENQEMADKRIPELLNIPAKVRFLSCEPLLSHLEIGHWLYIKPRGQYCKFCKDPAVTPCDGSPCPWKEIDWVIVGGESGSGCREFNADWARSLRDQCNAANVAFFMKQMGGNRKPFPEIPEDLMIREFPNLAHTPHS